LFIAQGKLIDRQVGAAPATDIKTRVDKLLRIAVGA